MLSVAQWRLAYLDRKLTFILVAKICSFPTTIMNQHVATLLTIRPMAMMCTSGATNGSIQVMWYLVKRFVYMQTLSHFHILSRWLFAILIHISSLFCVKKCVRKWASHWETWWQYKTFWKVNQRIHYGWSVFVLITGVVCIILSIISAHVIVIMLTK